MTENANGIEDVNCMEGNLGKHRSELAPLRRTDVDHFACVDALIRCSSRSDTCTKQGIGDREENVGDTGEGSAVSTTLVMDKKHIETT